MRIAFVHQPISVLPVPADSGSMEIWAYQVARQLAKSCEVTVYCRRGTGQPEFESVEGVSYRRVATGIDDRLMKFSEQHPRIHRLPLLRNVKRPLFSLGFAYSQYGLQVARDIRRRGFDVVHISNFSQLVPWIRALNPSVKIALHMQCEWLNQLDSRMTGRRLRKCDMVIGCSDFIRDKVRSVFPELAERCRTVYNGVDVCRFFPDESQKRGKTGAKRLLFVGRICPDKGPHILLEAFKRVAESHPQLEVEFVGWKKCPPREYVVNLTDDEHTAKLASLYNADYSSYLAQMLPPQIAKRVTFGKALAHPELASRYRNADILVCPSVWNEPFGIPLLEAMATGMPVIATQGGGFPEIVHHGKTGLLVPRGDAPALAEAILRLVENEDISRSMGEAGRQLALQRFTWDRIAEDLLGECRSLFSPGEFVSSTLHPSLQAAAASPSAPVAKH